MRPGLILLGVGLAVLWLVGLNQHATAWLTWLDLLVALASFTVAAVPTLWREEALTGRGMAVFGPFGLAAVLLVLWIVGLALHGERWLSWWNFAFAIGYGLLGTGVGSTAMERRRPTGPRTV